MASSSNTFLFSLFFLCFSTMATTTFTTQPLNLTNFNFLGDAGILNNTFRLTGDSTVPNSGTGRVLYNNPISFRRPGNPYPTSFSTHFSFSIHTLNPNSIGGGFAFVISPDNISIGAAGGFLGIPAGSVAVEFDTVKDAEFKDVNGNHVGLDIDSVVSLQVADLDSVNVNLKSGELIHSWVDYSGSSYLLNVFISLDNIKPKSPVLSISTNLSQYVDELMFVGFSGSTQGSTEVHSIEFWSFGSSFDESSTKTVELHSPPPPPPPPPSPLSPFNPMPIFIPPTTHTTRKNSDQLELNLWLVVPIVCSISSLGGITCYFTCRRDENRIYNICNWFSNANNSLNP